ncbi:hypothetical protein [Ramlibacter sp. PS4R-6]|uniref:hypothetical protein n=1 Tax=Ramlibacter sp. PS4R-6 TaxID=3133438 RepID=UPI0030968C56
MQTKTFEYGPYELICSATPSAGGGFGATLMVAISHGDASERTPVPLEASAFASEDEAIEHAAAKGRDWVDEHG